MKQAWYDNEIKLLQKDIEEKHTILEGNAREIKYLREQVGEQQEAQGDLSTENLQLREQLGAQQAEAGDHFTMASDPTFQHQQRQIKVSRLSFVFFFNRQIIQLEFLPT